MYDRQDVHESEYCWLPGSLNYGPPQKLSPGKIDQGRLQAIEDGNTWLTRKLGQLEDDHGERIDTIERRLEVVAIIAFMIAVLIVFACCRAAKSETLKGEIKCRGVNIHIGKTVSVTYPLTIKSDVGYIGIREDWQRRIVKIHPDSPAEKSGLKVGDVILEVDGKKNGDIIGPVGTVVEVVVGRTSVDAVIREHILIRRVPKSEIKPYGASPESKPGELTGEYWSNT